MNIAHHKNDYKPPQYRSKILFGPISFDAVASHRALSLAEWPNFSMVGAGSVVWTQCISKIWRIRIQEQSEPKSPYHVTLVSAKIYAWIIWFDTAVDLWAIIFGRIRNILDPLTNLNWVMGIIQYKLSYRVLCTSCPDFHANIQSPHHWNGINLG